MIAAVVVVSIAALVALLWHMQKPRPLHIAVPCVRFILALPSAPNG